MVEGVSTVRLWVPPQELVNGHKWQGNPYPQKQGTVDNFRRDCLRELKKIKLSWPNLHYRTVKGALLRAPRHIKKAHEGFMLPERTFMIFTPQGVPARPCGTGFAVLRPNVVITAAHVVEDYLPDLPRVVDTSKKTLKHLDVETVITHPSADVAALIVKNANEDCFFRLAEFNKDYYLGDEILSYGFPLIGNEKPIPTRLMKGHIQRVFDRLPLGDSAYEYKAYELAFPAFPGQSGAPVILDNFRVSEPRNYAAGVVTESVSYSSAHGDSAEATAAGYWAIGASLDAIGDWLRQL